MQLIKFLFEGFFIAVMGSYLIGKPIQANDVVIMASAIALMLILSDSFTYFFSYLNRKFLSGVSTVEAQLGGDGGILNSALELQHSLRQQTGGMDGTMSIQTAMRMQNMLQRSSNRPVKKAQSGGMDGTMSLQTALRMQNMLKSKNGSGREKHMPTQTVADNDDEPDAFGTYANYDTVYNIPEIPLRAEAAHPILTEKRSATRSPGLKHEINKRLYQSGGAGTAYLYNMDLIEIADKSGKHFTQDSSGSIVLTADKTGTPLHKLRFENVADQKNATPSLAAINYLQPVNLVFNDPQSGKKMLINYDGKLNTAQGKTQVKFMLIDSTNAANRGPVDLSKPVLLKTVIGNKFLDIKDTNILEGATAGAPFTISTATGCGPLWLYDQKSRDTYAASLSSSK